MATQRAIKLRMTTPTKKPLKRGAQLLIRTTADERNLLDAAAEHSGLTVGAWVRSVALHEARRLVKDEPRPGNVPDGT